MGAGLLSVLAWSGSFILFVATTYLLAIFLSRSCLLRKELAKDRSGAKPPWNAIRVLVQMRLWKELSLCVYVIEAKARFCRTELKPPCACLARVRNRKQHAHSQWTSCTCCRSKCKIRIDFDRALLWLLWANSGENAKESRPSIISLVSSLAQIIE